MNKLVIGIVLALLLGGCTGGWISKKAMDLAEEFCKPHEGVRYIGSDNIGNFWDAAMVICGDGAKGTIRAAVK